MKVAADERILGSGGFVEGLLAEVEKREKETLRLGRKVVSLPVLIKTLAGGEDLEEAEVRSGDRRRGVVKARRLSCQLAVRRMGYSGAELARYLGVTTSAVNRLALSEELVDLGKYLKLF